MSILSSSDSLNTLYEADDIIFLEGDDVGDLFIIKSGLVRIIKLNKERIVPIAVLQEKDFIGEMSVFSQNDRTATAIAITPVEVVRISNKDIHAMLMDCPKWINDIMGTLAQRLTHSTEILTEHKISDKGLNNGMLLNMDEEVRYQKIINEATQKRKKNLF